MTFEEKVLEILQDNYGGLKLGKLTSELISYHYKDKLTPNALTGKDVMDKLEQMDEIGLFTYPYGMREKTFVHLRETS